MYIRMYVHTHLLLSSCTQDGEVVYATWSLIRDSESGRMIGELTSDDDW